ncbi:TPA: hypothetical protein G8R56_005064 [Salmonella enterica]|uniref:Uncharacterized protein n=1 Tax=Salmonella enterica TaxID=28901 RepID=A0A759RP05_SALER|nr:hypothetical protein [Salmonella enterica]HAG1966774.1 hypothetical protein [Salmonella enterica]
MKRRPVWVRDYVHCHPFVIINDLPDVEALNNFSLHSGARLLFWLKIDIFSPVESAVSRA